jgi:hypothetical protein
MRESEVLAAAGLYPSRVSLFLSVHAVHRMQKRGITRDEVEEAIANAEVTYQSADDASRTVILGRCSTGRSLKVVVSSDDHDSVITVADRNDER